MTAFLAIVKLTMRSAMRSNIFRVLLFFLLLSVLLVPNTLKGDGTAFGYIQVILEYSFGFVGFILSVSAIWLSCSELCNDVESGQIHMIAVKPVSRITVWLGKYAGVLLIHLILLVLSTIAIYAFVFYQFQRQNFSEKERERTKNEVFTGRRVYMPAMPDVDSILARELERRIQDAKATGAKIPELDGPQRRTYLEELRKQILANMGEVKYGEPRFWEYSGLPEYLDAPIFIRYKTFSDTSSKNQSRTMGSWLLRGMEPLYETGDENSPVVGYNEFYYQRPPEEIVCGPPHEFVAPSSAVVHKGTVKIGFVNLAPDKKTLHFQLADGPKLLIRETGFLQNYIRAVLVTFLGIAALSGIACAAASFMSLPTAVFITVSYLLISAFSAYLLGSIDTAPGMSLSIMESIGYMASRLMTALLIPIQDFFVSDRLATGELIEYRLIGKLFLTNFILKGLPFFALGAYLYRRRELGTALKRG